ncbi:MAG: alpha/beta hydrolase [Actinomycetota bacterium]|nr:alpha/beta hydrolase [Actinomycetota bacterium]
MTVEERFADNAGVRIHYLDNRPDRPCGLPVLFVPGFVDRAADYRAVLDLFGDRRLLVVDPRGRGSSDSPETGYSAADQAGDLYAVLEDNGIERFHLMTFSRGTSFGLRLAVEHPEWVATVSIGDYLPAEIRLPPEFVEQMWATRWRGRPYPELISRVALEGVQAASVAREMWDDLGRLGLPTLVARGSDGAIIDDDRERRYRDSVPGVEVITIPGSGHDLFRPSRTAYPEAVLEFIARRGPGT